MPIFTLPPGPAQSWCSVDSACGSCAEGWVAVGGHRGAWAPHTPVLLPSFPLLFSLPAPASQILAASLCAQGLAWLCSVCG